jgi:hypothetical protein
MLIDTDGHGEPYAVFKPFRLTAAGWVSSEKGTPLAVTRPALEPDGVACGAHASK